MAEKTTDKPLPTIINDIKIQAWNEAITPRAPALLSLCSSDEFQNGILPWLRSVEKQMTQKLKFGCKTREDDQFVRGQLAILEEIINLPAALKAQIENAAVKQKQAESRGTAGY